MQKSKALVEARDYEQCLTQAQAVPQKSSRYTDAQKLLKQCEAGFNWQNVQVEMSAHSNIVWSVVFSPDGRLLPVVVNPVASSFGNAIDDQLSATLKTTS